MSAAPHVQYAAITLLPFGPMGVVCDEASVRALVFLPPEVAELAPASLLAERAVHALHQWLEQPEAPHALPLSPQGTLFQRRVWAAISAIPKGMTRRYGDIARDLGSAARAVGGACGANPFPLLVPCHRVVSGQGIGGFSGHTDQGNRTYLT